MTDVEGVEKHKEYRKGSAEGLGRKICGKVIMKILDFVYSPLNFSKNSVKFIDKVLRSRHTVLDMERGVFEQPHLYEFIFTRSVLLVRLPSATSAVRQIVALSSPSPPTTLMNHRVGGRCPRRSRR
ncbi:hypothetical protein LOAG_02580 [Loa loa]|uniref:Uncharacterized protein n=1 Tax=Loa loa TaxID=7209 RepID=A0A1I7VYK6_LOALO|nr:hypothetical protein LOAG_02580 [Loa loa]EFO25909.1 hypothetical protein LOAG_02580 [Loa loa]